MRYSLINLLFALMISVSYITYAAPINCQIHQCAAIVDAGSTGSRLHVYTYDLDSTQTAVQINEVFSKKINPGFAAIDANPASINTYLAQLFSELPTEKIPVYFYATAGMRLLPQSKQQQLYDLLENWFKTQPWPLISARTITGSEEGLFGWVAVNYNLDTLTSAANLVGVMDIGGASVQVSFPVTQQNTEHMGTNLKEFELYGHHFSVFTHSFLGLGQTEVTHQMLDKPMCFSKDYPLPNGLTASGDAFLCEKEVSLLVNNVHHVNTQIQNSLVQNPIGDWYVMGGMSALVSDPLFQPENEQFTMQYLIDETHQKFCNASWATLSAQYPNNEYLYDYCLLSSYYYALLVDGYGLAPNQSLHYMAKNNTADWSLGVILLSHNS